MIDLSDGLFIDLSRICDESGQGARIYLDRLPLSPALRRAASFLGLDPLGLAVSGGEDYELLITAPPRRKFDLPCVGEVLARDRVAVSPDGSERPFGPEGYTHWR
jgi:thiamine-monophosphate kinase